MPVQLWNHSDTRRFVDSPDFAHFAGRGILACLRCLRRTYQSSVKLRPLLSIGAQQTLLYAPPMHFTRYFLETRRRPDRAFIELKWIAWAVDNPLREHVQQDGRIRRWALIPEAGNRYLRVVLLADGITVHNAFFDRDFAP